jgi:cytochrome d ubiquinol oxidase subunit II
MSSEVLANIIYIFISFAWTVYILQELFISGSSALNMAVSKDEGERKQIQIATGIHWDGIEVWLIASLTLTAAAFPLIFGETLTYLYVPFFLLLYALIGRGIAIEVIYKLESQKWVKGVVIWWTVSSILIVFLVGIYITNVFLGFPLGADGFTSSSFAIFNVTGISGGLFFVASALLAGAAWIFYTTEGDLGKKALKHVHKFGVVYALPIFLLLIFMGFNNSEASIFIGKLFLNSPVLFVLPGLCAISAVYTAYLGHKESEKIFIFTLITMAFFLITGFVGTYPYLVTSHIATEHGITIFDAMVSAKSLRIITIGVSVFIPIIIFYQSWKYKTFLKKVKYNDE